MKEAILRARSLAAVRDFCTTEGFVRQIERARPTEALPPHRLSQLAASFAWHAERPSPEARLAEGASELARLWARAGGDTSAECELYLLLLRKLGLEQHELPQLRAKVRGEQEELGHTVAGEPDLQRRRQIVREQRPRLRELRTSDELFKDVFAALAAYRIDDDDGRPWLDQLRLRLPAEDATRWRAELRLRLALAAVQMVQTLQATYPLQQEVEARIQTRGIFPWR